MRNVFLIGADKKIKVVLVYPVTTGRNFDEVLRAIDSLQLTATYRVATPVNWRQGEDVIIAGSVSNEEAKQMFGSWKEPSPTFGSCRNLLRDANTSAHAGARGSPTGDGRLVNVSDGGPGGRTCREG